MNSEIEDRIQEARWDIAEEEDINIMEVTDEQLVYRLAEELVFSNKKLVGDLGPSEEVKAAPEEKVKRYPQKYTDRPDKPRYKYKFVIRDKITEEEEPWTGLFDTEAKADNWYTKFGSKAKLSPNKEFIKVEVEFVAKKKYKYKNKRL